LREKSKEAAAFFLVVLSAAKDLAAAGDDHGVGALPARARSFAIAQDDETPAAIPS
jgi:hypothetical protein